MHLEIYKSHDHIFVLFAWMNIQHSVYIQQTFDKEVLEGNKTC